MPHGAGRLALLGCVCFLSVNSGFASVDLQKLIDDAIRNKTTEVVIPPGVYKVKPVKGRGAGS